MSTELICSIDKTRVRVLAKKVTTLMLHIKYQLYTNYNCKSYLINKRIKNVHVRKKK